MLFDLDETLIGSRTAHLGRVVAFLHSYVQERTEQHPGAAPSGPRSPLSPSTYVTRLVVWCERRLQRGVRLAPEARQILDALEHADIPFGIVTNGQARKRHTLRLLGLDDRAAAVIISGERGRRKPDVAVFRRAATDLGVRPEAVLFVGDKARQDIRGARDAGMKTAWLRRGRARWSARRAAPDVVLASIGDVPAAVGLSPD